MMYRGYGMFGGGGILGLILIAIVAYFLIKYLTKNKDGLNTVNRESRAIEILKERYASGEISEEEYKNKLNKLNE